LSKQAYGSFGVGTKVPDGRTVGAMDALAALGLATAGAIAVGLGLRAHWLSGVAATYLAHAWFVLIPLAWYFGLSRKFPIGRLRHDQLRPWYVLWLLALIGNIAQAVASPTQAAHLPSVAPLAAELFFLAVLVGPTEELLFRGLIQTGLNRSMPAAVRLHGWTLSVGTVVAAVVFGLWHLTNLTYQALGPTVQQVAIATLIGLVIGVFYARTRNLIGASILHSLNDFLGTALPLAVLLVTRGH
jgi:membrane protease YdiL (CAAX protease family)